MSSPSVAFPAETNQQPQSTAIELPQKRVPKKIAAAIHLLCTGECKTRKAAAARVGLNASYLSEALQKPHVRVFIERKSRETIAAGLMRASARLNELVDAGSEHVSLDASKHLLAIAGIKPSQDAQVSVNIELKAGYVIDLRDEVGTHLTQPVTIEHET